LLLFVPGTFLCACISYAPAPLDTAAILMQESSAEIDTAAVYSEIARLAPSAEWDGHRLDSLSLLAVALASNPDIAQARATVVAVQADAKTARHAPGPTLTLTSEYAFNAPESSPWLYGIASDFTLDTGARRTARIDIAELNTKIAVFDFMDTTWSVRARIRRGLAANLLAQQELALAKNLADLRQQQLLAMEHRLAAGAASASEVQRVRADVTADKRRLLDSQARASSAVSQLAAAIGISPDALDVQALYWPDVSSPTALSSSLPAACRDESLLARPDIARASTGYDQAEAALRSAIAAQYPALHIGPGYTWERGLKKLPFTLAMSLPPLDLNRSAIDAAEARREEAGRRLEATVAAAMNAVQLAQDGYRAAWAQLENARLQTLVAERLATEADASFAAGAIGRVDRLVPQAAVVSSKLDEIASVMNVRDAEAALEDALRRPLAGPELAITTPLASPGESVCDLNTQARF
jgi:CRISPR system Cascade subunit CasA